MLLWPYFLFRSITCLPLSIIIAVSFVFFFFSFYVCTCILFHISTSIGHISYTISQLKAKVKDHIIGLTVRFVVMNTCPAFFFLSSFYCYYWYSYYYFCLDCLLWCYYIDSILALGCGPSNFFNLADLHLEVVTSLF